MRRANRLVLAGYTAVQEACYWALPLAPGLDLWGVDRQLRGAGLPAAGLLRAAPGRAQPHKILFVAPDPALAYGEPNEPGAKMLDACRLSLDSNRLFYLTGDVHHYERQRVGESLHVIAGGGGAFLHGSRIAPDAGSRPPRARLSRKATSRRLALGCRCGSRSGAGFLPHLRFGLLAAIEWAP